MSIRGHGISPSRRLRFGLQATAALLVCVLVSCAHLPRPAASARLRVRGPLDTRSLHPIDLTQLTLRPRRATVTEGGAWDVRAELAYASFEEVSGDDRSLVDLDGEVAHGALRLRRGVGKEMDVEVELGLTFATQGFLDKLIESWHRLLGLPNGGRGFVEDGRYSMRANQIGIDAYELEGNRLALSDVALVVTRELAREDEHPFALAWRAGVELPLGDDEAGFGNGGIDWGTGLVAERTRGRWSVFFGTGLVDPAQPDRFERAGLFALRRVDVQLGGEYRWSDRTSLLAEAVWTSPFQREIELDEFDNPILDLGVGIARDAAGGMWTLSFHDDVVAQTGADFVVRLAWRRR